MKNGKIQTERIRQASNFYFLVKYLIRNKDIKRKYKIDIYKIYFKKILLYGAQNWTTIKREESKIQAMEMQSFREGFWERQQRTKLGTQG